MRTMLPLALALVAGAAFAQDVVKLAPMEAVMVELKKPGAAAAKAMVDPVKVDPKHYKVVLENDDVRVLRAN